MLSIISQRVVEAVEINDRNQDDDPMQQKT